MDRTICCSPMCCSHVGVSVMAQLTAHLEDYSAMTANCYLSSCLNSSCKNTLFYVVCNVVR